MMGASKTVIVLYVAFREWRGDANDLQLRSTVQHRGFVQLLKSNQRVIPLFFPIPEQEALFLFFFIFFSGGRRVRRGAAN